MFESLLITDLDAIRSLFLSHGVSDKRLERDACLTHSYTNNIKSALALKKALLGKSSDASRDEEIIIVLDETVHIQELRSAWAFTADKIAQRNHGIAFKWEQYIRKWVMSDDGNLESVIKLYRHMYAEFEIIADGLVEMIDLVRNERNRICLLHVLVILVRKTRLKKLETCNLLLKYLDESNSEYICRDIDVLTRYAQVYADLVVNLIQRLPDDDCSFAKRILELVLGYLRKNDKLLDSVFSDQNFNLAFFMEKLFLNSLSRNSNCIVATELLLMLKNNKNLSYYMDGLKDVFKNHALDLLCLIRESCQGMELPALKSKSICRLSFAFWKMASCSQDQVYISEAVLNVLRKSPKSRHVLLQSMLKTDCGKSFLLGHLDTFTELISVELDLETCVKICYFKKALCYYHPVIDKEYFEKGKKLWRVVELMPNIGYWDMYSIAVVSLHNGWWNIGNSFLQTLSAQRKFSDKSLNWIDFLNGLCEEEDALISTREHAFDCELLMQTLEFMLESDIPGNLTIFQSEILTARRGLLRICLGFLKSYIAEIEIEQLIVELASSIRNLIDISTIWQKLGYMLLYESCTVFVSTLLAGRTLKQFESELDPCPEVVAVIETLDFKSFVVAFEHEFEMPVGFDTIQILLNDNLLQFHDEKAQLSLRSSFSLISGASMIFLTMGGASAYLMRSGLSPSQRLDLSHFSTKQWLGKVPADTRPKKYW